MLRWRCRAGRGKRGAGSRRRGGRGGRARYASARAATAGPRAGDDRGGDADAGRAQVRACRPAAGATTWGRGDWAGEAGVERDVRCDARRRGGARVQGKGSVAKDEVRRRSRAPSRTGARAPTSVSERAERPAGPVSRRTPDVPHDRPRDHPLRRRARERSESTRGRSARSAAMAAASVIRCTFDGSPRQDRRRLLKTCPTNSCSLGSRSATAAMTSPPRKRDARPSRPSASNPETTVLFAESTRLGAGDGLPPTAAPRPQVRGPGLRASERVGHDETARFFGRWRSGRRTSGARPGPCMSTLRPALCPQGAGAARAYKSETRAAWVQGSEREWRAGVVASMTATLTSSSLGAAHRDGAELGKGADRPRARGRRLRHRQARERAVPRALRPYRPLHPDVLPPGGRNVRSHRPLPRPLRRAGVERRAEPRERGRREHQPRHRIRPVRGGLQGSVVVPAPREGPREGDRQERPRRRRAPRPDRALGVERGLRLGERDPPRPREREADRRAPPRRRPPLGLHGRAPPHRRRRPARQVREGRRGRRSRETSSSPSPTRRSRRPATRTRPRRSASS